VTVHTTATLAIAGARAAIVCGVLAAGVGACGSDPPSRKPPAPNHALAPLPPAGRGGPAGATAVGFRAGDGVGLRGRLFGRGTAAVVLAHMGNAVSNEADWYPLARRLARDGYLVLAYNRRAVCSGEKAHYDCSAGANDWGKAWQDVVGAVRFVESRGARRVAVGGSSIGGTTAVYAAATGRIHPVALISLAGVNHISAYSLTRADVRRIGGAKLFVSGRRDADGGAASAREFNRWARPPKRMVLLNTDYHGTDLFARTAGPGIGRQLTKLIVRFLRASMPPEP
jgi:predicted alpha/beta-hydrolase family hydrolase